MDDERLNLNWNDRQGYARAMELQAEAAEEARRIRQEEEAARQRRGEESRLALADRKAEEARRAAEDRRAFVNSGFNWEWTPPEAGDPRPTLKLTCWGDGTADLYHARLRREKAEDEAAADEAARAAARAGDHHLRAAKLAALERDTRERLTLARRDLETHRLAVADRLGQGEDPSADEAAVRDGEALVSALEARLPAIEKNLEQAEKAAQQAEKSARSQALAQCRERRRGERVERERAFASALRPLLRQLLGVDEAQG